MNSTPPNNAAIATDSLEEIFRRQKNAFTAMPPPSYRERRQSLNELLLIVMRNRGTFTSALQADFGNRSHDETRIAEINGSTNSLKYALRHLKQWMQPERRSTSIWFMPGGNRVHYQPRGVVGIMSPWNYPLHLTIAPLAAAVAAGNRVMIKMSEHTPNTTALLKRLISENFRADEICVIAGEADVARRFAALAFDHLLFTGSTEVGKAVMRAASENLTPVTLELSGKSPAIVDVGYNLAEAARRIVWGKLLNAGQTCVAPDYVLVPEGEEDRFSQLALNAAEEAYPALVENPQYTSIINDAQYARIQEMIADARGRGARILQARAQDAELARDPQFRKLPLTIVLDSTMEMRVLYEEIFGPVLPVLGYRDTAEAVAYVNERPRPLALYLFTHNHKTKRRVLEETVSGGVTVNDSLLHYLQDDLPFGGVGASGMGSYHGREGFESFSHKKAVFSQRGAFGFTGAKLLYPPYGRLAGLLERVMGRFP
ncbi:MAG: coniferyl aldehyde dehydrogenase [Leptospirales bacterium]|jgi:coniferyl-aldehyde dehydrogenase